MAEIIGIIRSVEDDSYNGKDFKKVTLINGKVLKVKYGKGGALKKKWGMLEAGKAIKFTMGEFNGSEYVEDIETIEGALPKATKEPVAPTPQPPAPQELGMWRKEQGELYRMWKIHPETMPKKPWAKVLVDDYFAQMFSVLNISDGTPKPPTNPERDDDLEPEDIPF